MEIIFFIFFFGLLVLVHEFGHFYLAKKTGVKVEEFSIGFPPRIFKFHKGETIYSIGIVPFGGFVKLEGERSDDSGFRAQRPIKKIVITSAGIVFNLLLAYLIFSFALLTVGLPEKGDKLQILSVVPGSLAEKYLPVGAVIEKVLVDQQEFYFSSNISFISFIKENLGKSVTFVLILKDNTRKEVTITLPQEFDQQKGALGVYVDSYRVENVSFPKNFFVSFRHLRDSVNSVILSFYYLFLKLFSETELPMQVVGPIGIYDIFRQLFSINFSFVLNFLAIISVYLAILNLIPFPGLDGFYIFLATLEWLRGKRLKLEVEEAIIQIGLISLFVLLTIVTINDIKNIF